MTRGHVVHAVMSGSQGAMQSDAEGKCADIMKVAHNQNTGSGIGTISLAGDDNNDIILSFFNENGGDHFGDGDNAFLVAYITGAPAGDITITNNLNS